MKIVKNVGAADGLVRTILALALIGLPLSRAVTGLTATVFMLLAALFIASSSLSFCPLYSLLGINTCRTRRMG